MTPAIIALVLLAAPALQPPAETGRVVYYSDTWDWSRIAANHGLAIPDGYTPIAVPDCTQLGYRGELTLPDRRIPVFIADCAAPEDRAAIERRNIVAEIPYDVAAAEPGMIRDGSVPGTVEVRP